MSHSEAEVLETCGYAVKRALEAGVDEAEAYCSSSVGADAFIERNDLKLGRFHRNAGVGIRVFKKKALGFSSVNTLHRVSIARSVDEAVRIASAAPPDPYNSLPTPKGVSKISGIYDAEAEAFRPEDAVRFATDMLTEAQSFDARVSVDSGAFDASLLTHAVANSNGVESSERVSSFSWMIMGMAVDGGEVTSFDLQLDSTHQAGRVDVLKTARTFAENVVASLGSKRCEPFKGVVILKPQAAAELFIPALAHSVNSNSVQKGRSRLAGRLGEEVASEGFSIVDDATWPEGSAASSFDREGLPHRPLRILEGGVLKSYLYNTYTAVKDGVESTGHAVGDEESSPKIGPTNLVIEAGAETFEDLIKETRRGIVVSRFSGNVSPVSGDFSGVVKGGHLILGGRMIHPLRETLIAGNIFEAMRRISGMSKERQKLLSHLIPHIRLEDVSVTSE